MDEEPLVLSLAKKFTNLEQEANELRNRINTDERRHKTERETNYANLNTLQSQARDIAKELQAVLFRFERSISAPPTFTEPTSQKQTARELGPIVDRFNGQKNLGIRAVRRDTAQFINSCSQVTEDGVFNYFRSRGITEAGARQHARAVIWWIVNRQKWFWDPLAKVYIKPKVLPRIEVRI